MIPMQIDPLNSPHPVPWNWVLAMQAEATNAPRLRYYRSQSLISPDGQYAAYSRIQMQAIADWTRCQVSSVLFLENLHTGALQTISASSPLSEATLMPQENSDPQGTIAILIPVAWSAESDRILAREFESVFGSDIASDYAVVWDQHLNRTYTIAPTRIQYSNAILLGWSCKQRDHVLFQAGNLGDEQWPLWSVDFSGQTIAAPEDQPITYGRVVNNVWAGPQAFR
jgi:hypothetical protein